MTTTTETPEAAIWSWLQGTPHFDCGGWSWNSGKPEDLECDCGEVLSMGADPTPCRPSSVAEKIVRWDEVRDGDEVLCNGRLDKATVLPHGSVWQQEGRLSLMVGGTWYTPRRDALTAVRRYLEG
jgi:hypothetical protein